MTARIWKRRIAIIYVVLLLAVSATAIYFAIASARLESELQLKDANDLQNQAGSLEMRNKNDAENEAERVRTITLFIQGTASYFTLFL